MNKCIVCKAPTDCSMADVHPCEDCFWSGKFYKWAQKNRPDLIREKKQGALS